MNPSLVREKNGRDAQSLFAHASKKCTRGATCGNESERSSTPLPKQQLEESSFFHHQSQLDLQRSSLESRVRVSRKRVKTINQSRVVACFKRIIEREMKLFNEVNGRKYAVLSKVSFARLNKSVASSKYESIWFEATKLKPS